MDARLTLVAVLAIACAGCAAPQVRTVTDYCTPWRPIYPSQRDVLTDGTAKQILQHDETGATLCGWKPTPNAKAKQ